MHTRCRRVGRCAQAHANRYLGRLLVPPATICISTCSLGWWRLYVDAIIGRPYHSVFIITYFIYLIFKLYCYLLYNTTFEYALITIGETASFSEGFSRVCLLGLHAATLP